MNTDAGITVGQLCGRMTYRVTKNVGRWIEARFEDEKEKEAARETVEYLKACFPDKADAMERDIVFEGEVNPA